MKQILMFILFSAMLCWFTFAPVYKHILVLRQAILQKEVDYLLEVGANGGHGFVDSSMVQDSRTRLADRGFAAADLSYTVTTTTGVSGTNPLVPVMRGTGIKLVLTYPYGGLFGIDRLIGIVPPHDGGRMGAAGMKMSEFVP